MDEDNTGAEKDVHSEGYGRVLGGKKKSCYTDLTTERVQRVEKPATHHEKGN